MNDCGAHAGHLGCAEGIARRRSSIARPTLNICLPSSRCNGRSTQRRSEGSGNLTQGAIAAALAILVLSTGCATSLRNKQLEAVAKDWALVIRASQVIPVYPLSEDLQPGDVLLVSTPIDEQVALYKKKGFLPLD